MARRGAETEDRNRYLSLAIGTGHSARQHWRWLAGIGVALLLFLYGYEFVAGDRGLLALGRLRSETESLRARNVALKSERETLARQATATDLKSYEADPFLLEKTVRESRHLARPGEIIYTFDEAGTATTPTGLPEVTIAPRPPRKEKLPASD